MMIEELDPSRILKDNDFIWYMGEKYQKVKPPEPQMTLENEGEFDMVSYNNEIYFRMEFPTGANWWKRDFRTDTMMMVDNETLEQYYQEQVVAEREREMIKRNLKTSLQELANGEVRPIDDVVEEVKEEYPYKKYTPEETERGLKEAFREAVKQGVVSSVDKPKDDFDDLIGGIMKDPPPFLRFELGSTLENRIYKWWETCFTTHCGWSMEECIEDLLDIIELFLPGEQNSEGTQRIETEIAVEAHNELLRKIKSKLRNKKDT